VRSRFLAAVLGCLVVGLWAARFQPVVGERLRFVPIVAVAKSGFVLPPEYVQILDSSVSDVQFLTSEYSVPIVGIYGLSSVLETPTQFLLWSDRIILETLQRNFFIVGFWGKFFETLNSDSSSGYVEHLPWSSTVICKYAPKGYSGAGSRIGEVWTIFERVPFCNYPSPFRSGTFTIAQAPNDVVEELIRAGIRSARRYGLSWESSLAAFVVLMFVVSPNFDDCSSVRQVLLDPSKPPDCRLRELWDETTEDEWEQMRENYNPDAWVLREEGGGFV
jgi:hypothetical protein